MQDFSNYKDEAMVKIQHQLVSKRREPPSIAAPSDILEYKELAASLLRINLLLNHRYPLYQLQSLRVVTLF